ncbi:hypothetical protein T484DRAFT_1603204, partial [Baffinella frigidus]
GHAWAENNLAHCYETGGGVPVDVPAALRFYQRAAAQGHMLAQCSLGQAHAHGLLGLRASSTEGVRWYTAAAEQGNAKAMWGLGVMHRDGVAGLQRSQREAIAWIRKGAELGCAEAQSDLG